MRNLAGHPEATAIFRAELDAAGIPAEPSAPEGETKCAVEGVLRFDGFTLRVTRRWCYASVRLDPPLPAALARDVNDAPCTIDGGHYSGEVGTLGAVARADGDAGGRESSRINSVTGFWHVDHSDALPMLVAAVRAAIERHDLTAGGARVVERREFTSGCMAELPTVPRGSHLWRVFVRSIITDPRTDWDDPRAVALYADAREEVTAMLRAVTP